jgi:asparagine synthase (glutamine-hydrolysing)
MLAAFQEWGIQQAVQRFVGMFAIAVWDADTRIMHLIRDRMGKKPLYYCAAERRLLFGSELKSLFAAGVGRFTLDRAAVQSYLRHLYVPAPRSILTEVRKVPPGCVVSVPADAPDTTTTSTYWSLRECARAGISRRPVGTSEQLEAEFMQLLRDATQCRMYADVPLGVLLSGGIDSSLVTSVMQSLASGPVRTFCIGFDERSHDERDHARRIAEHLGTEHHEMQVSGDSALDVVQTLPDLTDEPLADPSVIPTYLVSKLAREQVTVVLTGDGGDELFAGYNRQSLTLRLHRLRRLPRAARAGAARVVSLATGSAELVDAIAGSVWRSEARPRITSARLAKLAAAMRARSLSFQYSGLISSWEAPAQVVTEPVAPIADPIVDAIEGLGAGTPLDQLLLADQESYLPDDLLAKVDRATMAVSLESRAPLLDHRLVEFSWSIPPGLKLHNGRGKWILRRALRQFVPEALTERPKTGFTVPIATWLRGPLKGWAESFLRESWDPSGGLFQQHVLEEAWDGLLRGEERHALGLWSIVQLQAWRRRWNV